MADITVQSGQGVTQAIASNLGLSGSDLKKVKLSVWQEVMTLVKENNTKAVSENKPASLSGTSDISKLNDKSSYKNNFLVHTGQKIEIDDSIWSKIKQLLTGKAPEVKTETTAAASSASQAANVGTPQTVKKNSSVSAADAFTSAATASNANIVADTPLEGSVETGKAANELFNKMGMYEDVKISVVSDEIEALLSKKNRTPEETEKMLTALHDGMKTLGNSMTKYIDSEYGDGSGKISKEAFLKWQAAGRDVSGASAEDVAQFEKDDAVMFNRMDLNKDGKIDNEEMSSFYMAMDFDEKNRSNGALDTVTVGAYGNFTSDPNQNQLDAKLKYAYGALYNKKPVEE